MSNENNDNWGCSDTLLWVISFIILGALLGITITL